MTGTAPLRLFCLQAALAALLAAGGEAGAGRKPPGKEKPKTPYERFLEKGRVRDFPPRKWEKAFERRSHCYRVRTNTSRDVAEYVGVLMDAVHWHYCRLFGVPRARGAAVNVFRTREEMFAWARKSCRFTLSKDTVGFYTPWGGGTICAVWKDFGGEHPESTLMHEGSHRFAAAVYGEDTLPIWLDEGFAVYFENSKFDGRNLDVGRIPVARLIHLQLQMRTGEHVTLEKLFATEQKKFNVDCYGAAWSFVFYLAHSGDERQRKIHQMALSRYVADCRRNRKDGKRLAAYLGLTMEQLEKKWKDWALKLDPRDPYGGVRKDKDEDEKK